MDQNKICAVCEIIREVRFPKIIERQRYCNHNHAHDEEANTFNSIKYLTRFDGHLSQVKSKSALLSTVTCATYAGLKFLSKM